MVLPEIWNKAKQLINEEERLNERERILLIGMCTHARTHAHTHTRKQARTHACMHGHFPARMHAAHSSRNDGTTQLQNVDSVWQTRRR